MILKNLMEEKQLDFNRPLLSVRRFSSTASSENDGKKKIEKATSKRTRLPAYKSEFKSGPVSNPGTVPFVWEKSPGRPKNESNLQTKEEPLVAPKLPPGRVLKVEQQDFDKSSKGASVTQSRTDSTVSNSISVASLDSKEENHDGRKEVVLEKKNSGSDNEDETYQDALETLSRAESVFMNCSVSGLSGCDDREAQPSESFLADQQARDFMIDFCLKIQRAAKLADQDCAHVHDSNENPSNLTSLKVVGGRKNGSENQFPMKLGQSVRSNTSSLKIPLALPSPKGPSESWLKRTLPTASSKSMSSRSNLAASIHTAAQTPNAALLDPKWETVVKSSKAQHGHLRFAEELAPIPEA
ncbi:hypothetical protein RYX36_035774 [Vicia faba]